MNIIELKNINKFFGEKESRQQILKNISINIEKGEMVAIMGWLQRAAVPARHAGRIYAAKAGCPPHQMIFAENAFLFAQFLLY